jgi:hypothetical protein
MAKKKAIAANKPARRALAPKPKALGDGTQASFALTFTVKDKEFTVSMEDIGEIKKNGLELKLPESDTPFPLGSFNDFYLWLGEELNLSLPSLDGIPIVESFLKGEIEILKFHIKTPGIGQDADTSRHYEIEVEITLNPKLTILGSLALSKVRFGVKYEEAG